MSINIVHQGRGGYIEINDYRFEIEMQAGEPSFCIYFPRRNLDKSLKKAKAEVVSLIEKDPGKWELAEYDSKHGIYDAMTVNERLYASGLMDDFDQAMNEKQIQKAKEILLEVEVPEESIEAILKNA